MVGNTSYCLRQQNSKEAAYEGLCEVISALPVSSEWSINVEWESETHVHETTKYVVTDKITRYGEDALKIQGRGGKQTGGKYEIIPKPNNSPWIIYYLPDNTIGWEEELKSLVVHLPAGKFIEEDSGQPLLLENIEYLKEYLGF
ncbi:hypothetical protein [Candidatus Halobonum tyrrellensis]|uniref:hypothetical protein n=1 Tax=Candidatus Halobonum tyrrellensis TaxID=1431545 RepID=UPI0012689E31|nr:hypothetical protein [Candidatus Halobonum tyrrellensis]